VCAWRHGKTDQEGQGATIGIVRGSIACPVAALQARRDAAGITTGPLFCSIRKGGQVGKWVTDQSVADIVKANAERVGLDPKQFAGHSLRAGFLTSAAKRGRLDLQDDGREPTPLGGYLARLCSGCGDIQRSCGVRIAVGTMPK
jgi:hypothetical protein